MNLEKPELVRVVCFDWGGVLVKICNSWEEACEAAGLPRPDPPIDDATRERRRELAESYHVGMLSCEDYFPAVAALSPGYSAADIERLHDAWLLHEYDGAFELTRELAAHPRLTTALLSNTNARHWARRSKLTAAGLLEHQIASHEHKLAKPDPALYRVLERAVGASGPQIVFFDDLDANVAAARTLGWQAVRVDPAGDPVGQVRWALRDVIG